MEAFEMPIISTWTGERGETRNQPGRNGGRAVISMADPWGPTDPWARGCALKVSGVPPNQTAGHPLSGRRWTPSPGAVWTHCGSLQHQRHFAELSTTVPGHTQSGERVCSLLSPIVQKPCQRDGAHADRHFRTQNRRLLRPRHMQHCVARDDAAARLIWLPVPAWSRFPGHPRDGPALAPSEDCLPITGGNAQIGAGRDREKEVNPDEERAAPRQLPGPGFDG